jgi:hypothetical protein
VCDQPIFFSVLSFLFLMAAAGWWWVAASIVAVGSTRRSRTVIFCFLCNLSPQHH